MTAASRSPRVVAVLSGGGAKAVAHLGALRALAEAGLGPAQYVGCSMGAVIAAGVAAGLTPDEMLARVVRITRKDVAAPARLAILGGLYLPSLLLAEPLRRTIAGLVPAASFGELRVPLTVVAVDLDSGARICFGAGGRAAPLVDALYASCALPMYYPPGIIEGRRYADGGLRGPLPLEVAAAAASAASASASAHEASLVVAVDIGPGFDDEAAPPAAPLPTMVRAHNEATGILMAEASALQLALWRADASRPPLLYIRPRVERHATFRVDRMPLYAEEGYRAAREAIAALYSRP